MLARGKFRQGLSAGLLVRLHTGRVELRAGFMLRCVSHLPRGFVGLTYPGAVLVP